MLLSCSVRRIADSLPKGIQRADRQDVVDPFFQKLQALLRREGKCPADEGQIYAVFAVLRKGDGIAGVEIGIGHSASIALMMKRRQLEPKSRLLGTILPPGKTPIGSELD